MAIDVEPAKQGNRSLIAAAVVVGLLAFLVGGSGVAISNPPEFHASWSYAWLLGLTAVLIGLVAARSNRSHWRRVWIGAGLGLGLLGAWVPTYAYYGNYHDYPWTVIGVSGALVVGGGLASGLRVVPIALAAFLLYWLCPAFRAPSVNLPVARQANGIECRVLSLVRNGQTTCQIELRDLAGRDLSKEVDLAHVQVEGHAGAIIGIAGWPAEVIQTGDDDFGKMPRGPDVGLRATLFPPSWVRSFDLRVTVPRWPTSPVASLTVPLQRPFANPVETQNGKYRLAVSSGGWGLSQSSSPRQKCFLMDVEYAGFDYSGFDGKEFRIVDDLGAVVPYYTLSSGGGEGGATETVEAWPIDPIAKFLTVQLYDPSQREASEVEFDFLGIANPR